MKKIIGIFSVLALSILLILPGKSYAATLDTLDIKTDKTTVRPGEQVTVSIEFGKKLGSYTFDVAYDNNLFEYLSAEGGTANDTTDKIKVNFFDTTGGTNPSSKMSVTFQAKSGITTSNPTEFTITADGLANADASERYDDITTPIVKNVTVEPEYIDYTINLRDLGNTVKDQEKDMVISFSSSMGRYYNHARLIAEATTPTGGSVQFISTDTNGLEHDIIQSGWGDAQGFQIGGPDSIREIMTRAKFTETGNYNITLKLIDRDNSDTVIAEQTFPITVTNAPIEQPANLGTTVGQVEPTQNNKQQQAPQKLPKTGSNIYAAILLFLVVLVAGYVYFNKKK